MMLTTSTYSEVGETLTSGTGSRSSSASRQRKYSYKLCISGSEKESAAAWLAAAMSAMSTTSPSLASSMAPSHHHHNHHHHHHHAHLHHTKTPTLVGVVAAAAAAANLKVALSLDTNTPTLVSSTVTPKFDFTPLDTQSPSSLPKKSIINEDNNNNHNHNNNNNNNNNSITNGTTDTDDCILTFDPKTMNIVQNHTSPHVTSSSTPSTAPVDISPKPTRRLSRPLTPPKVDQLEIPSSGLSPPSSTFLKQQAAKPAKPLLPFGGREDKVRRTSILRPPAHLLDDHSYAKKNVRFADAMGLALENVRLFSIAPPVSRRYSSYNAPTTKHAEFDSPWNMALAQRSKELSFSSPTFFSQPLSNGSLSSSLPSKRYDLVPANFASPSLQLNFDAELERQGVLLHSLTCAETTIYGTVSVMNRHFDKHVLVRYSFNDWQTFIERECSYMLGSHDGRSDKFSFAIYARPEDFHHQNFANSGPGRLHFAICFKTGDGQESWDNNHDRNYTLSLATH